MTTEAQRAATQAALDALVKSIEFCNHIGTGDWQPTVMACHRARDALTAALAEQVQEPVEKISLKDGRYLKLEPYYFLGPTCWILYTNNDVQIRALDEFEAGFVNAALKAAPQAQQPAPPADVPLLDDDWIIDMANEVHRAMPAGSDEQDELLAVVREAEKEMRQKAGLK